MPRSRPLSRNALPLAALASLTAMGLGAATAPAAAQGSSAPYFQAELSAPAADARVIAGGVLWRCEGTSCIAGESEKRPLRVCRDLNREVGELASFSVDGAALEADRLARCNG